MDRENYENNNIWQEPVIAGSKENDEQNVSHMNGSDNQYNAMNGSAIYNSVPPKKKNGSGKKVLALILVIVIAAAAGFGGGIAGVYAGSQFISSAQSGSNISIKTDSNINTAEAIAEKVSPSVVGISTQSEVTYQSFFGQRMQETQTGVGTGTIVDESGYILTNSHVVNDGSVKNIMVSLADGREVEGKVLWSDSSIDLAIVKIEADNLTAAELGDSEDVRVGAYVVAIGNPLGLAFQRSVTQGIISGLNRTIDVTDGNKQSTMDGLIQTDASINSGNSGGPLLNSKGQVIGINTAKAQTGEGLGFAIPINTAKPIVEEIITKGEFSRAYIGITGISVENLPNMFPDVQVATDTGAYVVQIYTDSPAAKAGLKEGDVIVAVNDDKVETITQLISDLYKYRPGDQVTLKVLRGNKTLSIEVTLATDESVVR